MSARRLAVLAMLALAAPAGAQDRDDLARQLANPIASLTSVPFQFNVEDDRLRLNLQPVIPIPVDDDWNLISRTVLPAIERDGDIALGNTLQSFFLSPQRVGPSGWVWGVGVVVAVPTAEADTRWGLGPTAVVLRQTASGWTYGALVNHVRDISFAQPFVARRIGPGRTVSANLEASYDHDAEAWKAPLNLGLSQILPWGRRAVSLQAGIGYALEGEPEWSARFTVTLLFPRGG